MQLDWLADALRARGLNVVEYSGWKTRSARDFSSYQPVGIINHHTAGYYYLQHYPEGHWPDSSLAYKCNITIRPDGSVHVLNAGWAYDSGNGSRKVLEAVRNDRPLPSGDLRSDIGGNAYFIDIEVQHLGDGGRIEPAQRNALIECNAAICDRMGWDPRYRVIGHREWAPDRKVDPRWDGVKNPMPGIRQDTLEAMEDNMPLTDEDIRRIWDHKEDQLGDFIDQPPQRVGTLLAQAHANAWQAVKQTTRYAIVAAVAGGGGFAAGTVVDEIARRLGGG